MSEEFQMAADRRRGAPLAHPPDRLFEATMFVGEALLAVAAELMDVNRSLGAVKRSLEERS